MTKSTVRMCALLLCTFLSSFASAQSFCGTYEKPESIQPIDPESQIFMDRFGNHYSAEELAVSKMEAASANKVLSGDFNLTFSSGFSSAEMITICDVFAYISDVITLTPQGSPPEILISRPLLDPGILGTGSPIFRNRGCGFGDNMAFASMMGGLNADEAGNLLSGFLNITSGATFHTPDADPIGSSSFDLYTVVLHEALHILAFSSLIDADGSDAYGIYSMWDEYLYNTDINDFLLLDAPGGNTCCSRPVFNSLLTFPDDVDDNCANNIFFHNGSGTIAQVNANYGGGTPNDNTVKNILSHLDRCGTSGDQYVMFGSLAAGETRREMTGEEMDILFTLGYPKAGSTDFPCIVIGAPELVGFENGVEIPFSAFLDNDIIPTGGTFSFPAYCGNIWSISTITITATGIIIDNVSYSGVFSLCYLLEGCNGDCYQVQSQVFIFPDLADCGPCENGELFCHGSFDEFLPNTGYGTELQLGLPFCSYDNGVSNSADIYITSDGGRILRLASGGSPDEWLEHVYIPLSPPLEPGCKIEICLDALGFYCSDHQGLDIYGTNVENCSGLWESDCNPMAPYYCLGTMMVSQCYTTQELGFEVINCSHPLYPPEYNCSPGYNFFWFSNPLNLETICLEAANESTEAWNYLVISKEAAGPGGSVLVDNLHITSDCCDGYNPCGLEIIETCKDHSVTLTVLQDGIEIPMYNSDCCVSWTGVPGIPTIGCPPNPGMPAQNFNNINVPYGQYYCVEVVCGDCKLEYCGYAGDLCLDGGKMPEGLNQAIPNQKTPGIQLAPNPASLQIELSGNLLQIGQSWEIYDLNGRRVHAGFIQSEVAQEIKIEEFTDGLYFIQLRAPDGVILYSSRFVKQ
ncbi:MAG: T9SS type A sorting domain-containing protein [Saprospiraceae bacterium]|nr:T9SS type A sorting domain-containing protein [Saprospiraceae bacterium]